MRVHLIMHLLKWISDEAWSRPRCPPVDHDVPLWTMKSSCGPRCGTSVQRYSQCQVVQLARGSHTNPSIKSTENSSKSSPGEPEILEGKFRQEQISYSRKSSISSPGEPKISKKITQIFSLWPRLTLTITGSSTPTWPSSSSPSPSSRTPWWGR